MSVGGGDRARDVREFGDGEDGSRMRITHEDAFLEAASLRAQRRHGPKFSADQLKQVAREMIAAGAPEAMRMFGPTRAVSREPAVQTQSRDPGRLKQETPQAPPRDLDAERRAWLMGAARFLRPTFSSLGLGCERVLFDIGPLEGDLRGWCRFDGELARVTLSPSVATTAEAVTVLLHELTHACLGPDAGHGPHWKAAASAVGLDDSGHELGPVGGALVDVLNAVLGAYPT